MLGGGGGNVLGGAGSGGCALDEETLRSIDDLDLSKVCIFQRVEYLVNSCQLHRWHGQASALAVICPTHEFAYTQSGELFAPL